MTSRNLRSLALAAAVLVVFAAPAAATPVNNTLPAVSGNPIPGSTVTCNGDSWSPAQVTRTFEWRYADTVSAASHSSNSSTYGVQADDVGHQLFCRVSATDDNNGTPAAVVDSPAVLTYAPAIVRGSAFSPIVTGNVGSKTVGIATTPGISVTVELRRGNIMFADSQPLIASATAGPTLADGEWTATLPGHVIGDPRDIVIVRYSGLGAPSDAVYTAIAQGINSVSFPNVNSFGIDANCNNCAAPPGLNGVSYLVDGTLVEPTSGATSYHKSIQLGPEALVTVLERHRVTSGSPAAVSYLQYGIPGPLVGDNAPWVPSCSANLTNGVVVCNPLVDGNSYTVQRNASGTPVALALAMNSTSGDQEGTATLLGVKPGDQVILKFASGKTISTLHVGNLTGSVAPDGRASGTCEPFQYFGHPGSFAELTSQVQVCPASGVMADLPGGAAQQDEFSNGRTLIGATAVAAPTPIPGTGTSPITTTSVVAIAAVSKLGLSPASFFAAPKGGSIAKAKKKKVYGTTVSYTLSAAATPKFTVERPVKGRRVGKSCAKKTKKNRKKKSCTRYETLKGSFTRVSVAGANKFKFTGRLAGKKLRRGSYRLVVTPPGGIAVRKAFRIKG